MDKTHSVDKILLDKGLITPEQLTQAIQFQCRLAQGQEMPLSEVLVEMEFITEAQLKEALGEKPPTEDLLVQQLFKDGLIQEDQLAEVATLRQAQHADKRLGTMLFEMGYATKETIESALTKYYLEHHSSPGLHSFENPVLPAAHPLEAEEEVEAEPEPLGQRLMRMGYISQDELQDAMDYQQRLPRILHKPIGEILVTLGYLSQEELNKVVQNEVAPKQLSLGDILVRMGVIQTWQLSHAMSLKEQPEHQQKKLGLLLIELGYARRPDIENALKQYYEAQQQRGH